MYNQFLILKNEYENQNFAIFEAIFIIELRSAKDLLK
jgi:hypothetical protein